MSDPAVVERIEQAMERYAPAGYDPSTDDMTIPFAMELAEKDRTIAAHVAAGQLMHAEIANLRAALKECADDLEAEVEARYSHGVKEHPAMTPKYNRDMAPVYTARDLLATTGTDEQTAG